MNMTFSLYHKHEILRYIRIPPSWYGVTSLFCKHGIIRSAGEEADATHCKQPTARHHQFPSIQLEAVSPAFPRSYHHFRPTMPPWQQRSLKEREPARLLSWLSVPRCAASMTADGSYGRQHLVKFRHQLRTHEIAYFGASHNAWVLSRYSSHFYRATLRSLLELDHAPWLVRIPTHFLPHNCFRCQGDALPPPFNISLQFFTGKAGLARRIGSGYRRVSHLLSAITASSMRTAAVPTAWTSMVAVSWGRTSRSTFPASLRLRAPWRTQHSTVSIPLGHKLGRLPPTGST